MHPQINNFIKITFKLNEILIKMVAYLQVKNELRVYNICYIICYINIDSCVFMINFRASLLNRYIYK